LGSELAPTGDTRESRARVMKANTLRRMAGLALGILFSAGLAHAGNGALELRKGYFWDPQQGDYFLARGMAYQTWNPPVGADQSVDQLRADLVEFKKLHCNSVRCEMVWSQVEPRAGEFDWTRPDALVRTAEELGLKLFVLVGFNYAPAWFSSDWMAVNSLNRTSVVLNYEHPEVRRTYANYIAKVTGRYRDSTAVGAWILGNEYAYFDLWNPDHRFLGYDPHSLRSFRTWLAGRYSGDIQALNEVWETAYAGFEQVAMPRVYPADRHSPAYHDLIQWREASIGEYVAVGAVAARAADPNHLRTYSMIGGLFIGYDSVYTCEDARTIVEHCAAAGAPLDFWSINNYAWATLSSEMRLGDFGISRHRTDSGLPVFISETGHSTTDNLIPGAAARQGDALPAQMWEAFMAGAIGTHLFTWNDRELFGGVFQRERGLGVVHQNRTPKSPAYANLTRMFQRMEELRVERLFAESSDPPANLGLFWPKAAKMGWPRANQENAMLWNALKRLGYEPRVLTDAAFERGEATDQPVLILSRCYQMEPQDLDRLSREILPAGIHLHANADLPGRFDARHRLNPAWPRAMDTLFGLEVTRAVPAWDAGVLEEDQMRTYRKLFLQVVSDLGPLQAGFTDSIRTWKIWQDVRTTRGTTVATHTGIEGGHPPHPGAAPHHRDRAHRGQHLRPRRSAGGGCRPTSANSRLGPPVPLAARHLPRPFRVDPAHRPQWAGGPIRDVGHSPLQQWQPVGFPAQRAHQCRAGHPKRSRAPARLDRGRSPAGGRDRVRLRRRPPTQPER